jgi:hypothetical protein
METIVVSKKIVSCASSASTAQQPTHLSYVDITNFDAKLDFRPAL